MKNKLLTFILVLLALLLMFADSLFSQTFLGIGATNKGIPLSIGTLIKKAEIKGSYIQPYPHKPAVSSLTLGYQINLTKKEKDNYSITPSIGYSNVRWKDFSDYKHGGEVIRQVNEYHPAIGLEIGKDLFLGRYYISGNYFNALYLGIGIKAYFRYNQVKQLKY